MLVHVADAPKPSCENIQLFFHIRLAGQSYPVDWPASLQGSMGKPTRRIGKHYVVAIRGHFQTTFADLNVIMTLGGRGSGAVTLLLTTRVEHVTACPWVWFFNQKV